MITNEDEIEVSIIGRTTSARQRATNTNRSTNPNQQQTLGPIQKVQKTNTGNSNQTRTKLKRSRTLKESELVFHRRRFKLIESIIAGDNERFKLIARQLTREQNNAVFVVRDDRNRTLLHLASFYGRVEIVDFLIKSRELINDHTYCRFLFSKDKNSYYAFDLACIRGYGLSEDEVCSEEYFRLVEHLPCLIENVCSNRAVIVDILVKEMKKAIGRGYRDIPSTIIKQASYKDNNSPLHWAIYWGDLQLSILLVLTQFEQLFWVNKHNRIPFDLIHKMYSLKQKTKALLCIYTLLNGIKDRILGLEAFSKEMERVAKTMAKKRLKIKKDKKKKEAAERTKEEEKMDDRVHRRGTRSLKNNLSYRLEKVKTIKEVVEFWQKGLKDNTRKDLEKNLGINPTDFKRFSTVETEVLAKKKFVGSITRNDTELELNRGGMITMNLGASRRRRNIDSRHVTFGRGELGDVDDDDNKKQRKGTKRLTKLNLHPDNSPGTLFKRYKTIQSGLIFPRTLNYMVLSDEWDGKNQNWLEEILKDKKDDLVLFERSKYQDRAETPQIKRDFLVKTKEIYDIIDETQIYKLRWKIDIRKIIYLQRLAAWYCYFEMKEPLLRMISLYKISPFMINSDGINMIHLLCSENRYQFLYELISLNYRYVNSLREFNLLEVLSIRIPRSLDSPAHISIQMGSSNIIFLFMEIGVPFFKINERGWSCDELMVKYLSKEMNNAPLVIQSQSEIGMSQEFSEIKLKKFISTAMEAKDETPDDNMEAFEKRVKMNFDNMEVHFDFLYKEKQNDMKISILDKIDFFSMEINQQCVKMLEMREYDYCLVGLADARDGYHTTVYKQIENLRDTYKDYGRIQVEVIESYDNSLKTFFVQERWWGKIFCCRRRKSINLQRKYFYLLKVSNKLMERLCYELEIQAYNMKYKHYTKFSNDPEEIKHYEPLREIQKQRIILHLIRQEFDLDKFKSKRLLIDHFPVNNFRKVRINYEFWWEKKWTLILDPLINFATKKGLLRPYMVLGFYHGLQSAFHFAFLNFYTGFLLVLCVLSLGSFLYGLSQSNFNNGFMPLMLVVVAIWGTIFEITWQKREKELAYAFGTLNKQRENSLQHGYHGKYVIDQITNKVTKHNTFSTLKRRLIAELPVYVVFFLLVIISLILITRLTLYFEELVKNGDISEEFGYLTQFAIGGLNSLIIFLINLSFRFYLNFHVRWENHKHAQDEEESRIFKRITLFLFSTFFTLVYFVIRQTEFNIIYSLVSASFITTSILNIIGIIGGPYIKYKYFTYILNKKSKEVMKGEREKFLQSLLYQKLRYAQFRYKRLGQEEGMNPADDFKGGENAPLKRSYSTNYDFKYLKSLNLKNFSYFRKQKKDFSSFFKFCNHRFSDLFDDYWNFEYRLLKREQLEHSLNMIPLEDTEEKFYEILVIQYGWLVLFLPIFPLAAPIAVICNFAILGLTARSYRSTIRRSTSKNIDSIGIWNSIFMYMSYLGVMFYTVIILYPAGGLNDFLNLEDRQVEVVAVLVAEHILLIFKFFFARLLVNIPKHVKLSMEQERYRKKLRKDAIKDRVYASRSGFIRGRQMSDQF